MIETETTVEARNQFSKLINRVAFGKERIVITRRERKLVAVVPFDDFLRLIELDEPARSSDDAARFVAAEVQRALKAAKIPW